MNPAEPSPSRFPSAAHPGFRFRLASVRWMGFPLAVFAFSRLAIFSVTRWSLLFDPRTFRSVEPMKYPAIEGLCRWDCAWFWRIGMDGYREPQWTNFFPLFPLAGKAIHFLTGLPWNVSLVLVANVVSLAAWIVIYRLFVELEGREAAQSGLVLLAAWPFSFFQAAGYPESMMTLATAGSLLLAMHRRHFSAGVVLGLGILARHLTIIGGLALVVEQLRQRPGLRRFLWHPAILGLFVPFVLLGGYLAFQYARFDDALAFLHARSSGWGQAAWYGVADFFRGNFRPLFRSYVWLSLVPGAGALLLLRRRTWWSLAAFAIPLIVMLWGIGLMGLGRYTGSMWPAFLPLGVIAARRPWLKLPATMAFGMLQALFLILYVHAYDVN